MTDGNGSIANTNELSISNHQKSIVNTDLPDSSNIPLEIETTSSQINDTGEKFSNKNEELSETVENLTDSSNVQSLEPKVVQPEPEPMEVTPAQLTLEIETVPVEFKESEDRPSEKNAMETDETQLNDNSALLPEKQEPAVTTNQAPCLISPVALKTLAKVSEESSEQAKSFSETLLSTECLDRTSPELWPEKVPGISGLMFNSLPNISPSPWAGELSESDLNLLQKLGSLSPQMLITEVRKLHDLAFTLGFEESREVTRGKYLNIFRRSSNTRPKY